MSDALGEKHQSSADSKDMDAPVQKDFEDASSVPVLSPSEDRKLLLRIDLFLIPVMLFSYLFQALDKSSLSYSSIMGLRTDLGLVGDDYSWASSIYYFGYLAFSYPTSYLIVRLPIGKLIGGACTLWGAILLCMAGTSNYKGLLAARFFLGAAESVIAPSLAVLVSMWYKKSEQPLRHGVWFLGNVTAGFFASLLAYAISHIQGFSPWKVLFILFGGVTMLWGVCLMFLLPDHPTTAWFLKTDQRQKAVIRVASNMTSIKDEHFKIYQLLEGLKDVNMWLLFVIMVSSSLANGLASFQSIIIKGFGFSTVRTYLMQMIPTAFQALYVIIAAGGSTFIKNSRTYFMMFNFILAVAGAVMVYKIDESRIWARFFGYCLCIAFSGNFPMIFTMSTANIAGFTKKSTVNAALFVGYCAANIASPQFFIDSESPSYPTGFKACFSCLSISFIATVLLRLYLIWQNKKRDQQTGHVEVNTEEVNVALGLSDKTDWEISEFRYVL